MSGSLTAQKLAFTVESLIREFNAVYELISGMDEDWFKDTEHFETLEWCQRRLRKSLHTADEINASLSHIVAEGPVLLTQKDVAKLLKVNTWYVEHLVRLGQIPKPVYLSPGSPRWRREELMAAIRRMKSASVGG